MLASTFFTIAAAIIVGVAASPWRSRLVDPARLAVDNSYQNAHLYQAGVGLITISGVACLLATVLHLWRRRGFGPPLRQQSLWDMAFRSKCPPKRFPYVRVRVSNGSTYTGFVSSYTVNIETSDRELMLEPPLWSKNAEGKLKPVLEWQRIVIRGEDVTTLMVQYRPRADDPSPDENYSQRLQRRVGRLFDRQRSVTGTKSDEAPTEILDG